MRHCVFVVVTLVVCISALAVDDCKDCKCTKYPPSERCEKCCGVATGKVTAYTRETVSLRTEGGEGLKLSITGETKVEGTVKEGATVGVVYNRETRKAGLIEVK